MEKDHVRSLGRSLACLLAAALSPHTSTQSVWGCMRRGIRVDVLGAHGRTTNDDVGMGYFPNLVYVWEVEREARYFYLNPLSFSFGMAVGASIPSGVKMNGMGWAGAAERR